MTPGSVERNRFREKGVNVSRDGAPSHKLAQKFARYVQSNNYGA
jgi:hypothetical protein